MQIQPAATLAPHLDDLESRKGIMAGRRSTMTSMASIGHARGPVKCGLLQRTPSASMTTTMHRAAGKAHVLNRGGTGVYSPIDRL